MQTITVAEEWTYRTPRKTITYAPGTYEVTEEIADVYERNHEEPSNGNEGASTPRAPRRPRQT